MKTEPNDTINQMTMEAFQKSGQIGLTKREHFAGLAMQGLMHHITTQTTDDIVSIAVRCADQLIAELNRTQE